MSSDSVALVVANLVLAAVVLVPAALVVGAGIRHLLDRRHRSVTMVDLPGIGRIPVLRR